MAPVRIQCRFQSTFRRSTRATAMAGATSMRTSKVSGPPNSHIIFNPPPTIPNVYHTPLKFLPANDPRRKLYESGPSLYSLPPETNSATARVNSLSKAEITATPVVMSTPGTALREVAFSFPAAMAQRIPADSPLPPAASKQWQPEQQLTQAQVEDIRRLRRKNPKLYTVNWLADKYGCSRELVKGIQSAPLRIKVEHRKRVEQARAKWGKKTKLAFRDRLRRQEMWSRDA